VIRIVTFNIRNGLAPDGSDHWELRKELVADLFRDLDPDILALQEPFGFQMDFVSSVLSGHDRYGVGRGRDDGEYCGLFTRRSRVQVRNSGTFWLSDTPAVPGSTSWGNTIPRICTWMEVVGNSSPWWLYNAHLDHESAASRLKSVDLIQSQMQHPCVWVGDFNAEPSSPEIQAISLQNAFAETPDEGLGTWHAFTGQPQQAAIDYVFVDPEFSVQRAWVDRKHTDGRYPSDHFPLIVEIEEPRP